MKIKKTLCGLVAGLAFALNSHSGIDLPEGYEYINKDNYYKFNGIHVTKIYKDKKIGWFVYDTKRQEIIGDESDELNDYRRYSTRAEAKNLMDALKPEDVRDMALLYKKGLAGYEIVYKLPNFVLEKGSKLEGKLLKAYFTGGKDLSDDAQKRIIKDLINEEKREIVDGFYKGIFGDEEVINPLEATQKVKKHLLNTVEGRLLTASLKLDKAADILERNKNGELSYKDAKEFLDNFIEGNSTGRAYLNAIDRIDDNVNWKTLTQKIVKNLADGFGVKDNIEDISMKTNDLLNVDLAGFVFGDKDFMDVFDNIEKEYMEEREKWFKNVEGKYSLEKDSVSVKIIKDLGKEREITKDLEGEKVVKKEKIKEIKTILKKKKEVKEREYNGNIKEKMCGSYWDFTPGRLDFDCIFKEIDLNNDNVNEIMVTSEGTCGTGGCLEVIYDFNGNLIDENFGSIVISKNKTNGYYDIVKIVADYNYPGCDSGSSQKAWISTLYKWDGRKYVKNNVIKKEPVGGPCEIDEEEKIRDFIKKLELCYNTIDLKNCNAALCYGSTSIDINEMRNVKERLNEGIITYFNIVDIDVNGDDGIAHFKWQVSYKKNSILHKKYREYGKLYLVGDMHLELKKRQQWGLKDTPECK